MQGPEQGIRAQVAQYIDAYDGARDPEEVLQGTLDFILGEVRRDAENTSSDFVDDPYAELAAIDSWAGLASHAVQTLYAPGSPNFLSWWQGRNNVDKLAGWAKGAVETLRKIADALRQRLVAVAKQLKSFSFSVGVGFPWGVSISISWQA